MNCSRREIASSRDQTWSRCFREQVCSRLMAFVAFAACLALTNLCSAQEDPFAPGAPKPAVEGAAPAAAKPAVVDPTKHDPLPIELLRAAKPTTPEQLLAAAQGALQFGRADEAKRYLAQLLASKPADETLAPLTTRYADFLFEISRKEEVQPEGREVADVIFGAAQRTTQNAERIAVAIAQLSDPQPSVRQEALGKLAQAGASAVNPMLHALADASREKEHANIRGALTALGGAVEMPLIGALETPNEALRVQIVAVLGRMGSSRAAVHLVRPALDPRASAELRQISAAALKRISGAVPDLSEAERFLTREAGRFLRGELPYEKDALDRVTLWSWQSANEQVVPVKLPLRDAGVLLAARTANDLYILRPSDNAAQRLMLLTNLELAKVLGGLDRPLAMTGGSAGAVAAASGTQVVNQVLADAMRLGRVPAAIAAADVLGQIGDPAAIHTHDGPSPLAEAMIYPDRRVRLAAALAAVKLAPGDSFPGAGRVSDVLTWFLGTGGTSVVLIGHPRGEEAQSLVGFMNALGYEGEGAYVGRVLVERALANPDYEFVLISDAIDLPPVEELVQWLRRDFRTARMPIGVMARGERLDALRDALRYDPLVTVFPRIHSVEVAANEVDKLRAIAGRNLVGRDERLAEARAALAALTVLAKDPKTFARYDLSRHEPTVIRSLNNPALTADSAGLLALYATPKSQTALVDFASQNSRPLTDRQAAAAAFAAAVKRRGIGLTQQQIAQQYARYNTAAALDQPTQELLGLVLDTLEAPAIARGELGKQVKAGDQPR
jgi:hypothetical protein